MFITIKLHGVLAKKFGKSFKCIASSASQAIRFLDVNFPDFKSWVLAAQDRGIVFKVRTNEYELSEDELIDPVGEGWTIHITPLFAASGNTMKVILGIGLIALGAFGVGFLGLSPLQMIITGALLLISGLMGKRTPAADPDDQDKKSFVFSGSTNTVTVGGRVPVVYGLMQVGSTVLSAAVRSYQTA